MSLSAPQPLHDAHRLETFRCTEPELEIWLRQRARRAPQEGASRCVISCEGDTVAGYYALAAGSVLHAQATGNMPDPIPVVVLGRLAVHTDYQGRGLGADLLKDAVLRSLRLSRKMGIRALSASRTSSCCCSARFADRAFLWLRQFMNAFEGFTAWHPEARTERHGA